MARTLRIRKDGDAHYHVMSRTNNKAFLFEKGRTKGKMVELLERTAAFSGVELEAHSMLDNHFHAFVRIVKPDEPVLEAEVVRRIGILKGAGFAETLTEHWAELRGMGMAQVADAQVNQWRSRMHDVSQFVKTFKELVSIFYKSQTKHVGSIWAGRFTSTLVEDGRYRAMCIRYIELNAVRAGLVKRAKDYPYSSHNSEKPLQNTTFAGTVPAGGAVAGTVLVGGAVDGGMEDERLLKRVAQIGAGKIFGSRTFVMAMIARHTDTFGLAHVVPRPVVGTAYASHGHLSAA